MMKKRLSKSHSAPEGLPRIPTRQSTGQTKVQENKYRHHSASGICPWGPERDVSTLSAAGTLKQQTNQAASRPVLTPFPMMRSSTFHRYGIKPYTQPLLTILQTEYESDPAISWKQSNAHLSECPVLSDVDCEHSDISSESGVFPGNCGPTRSHGVPSVTRDAFCHRELTRTVPGTYVMQRHQKQMRLKRRPPRTPTVSPVGHRTGPADSSTILDEVIPYSHHNIHSNDIRWDEDTESDDVPSVVTCPVLTKDVLSSNAINGHAVKKQDRVFDWLASCDEDVRSTSLPPHLPDINGLKRYNTTVA